MADVFKADSPVKRTSRVLSGGVETVLKKVNKGGFSHPVGAAPTRKTLGITAGERGRSLAREASEPLPGLRPNTIQSPVLSSNSLSKPGLEKLGLAPLERAKRVAADSPASYRTACATSSPATYQVQSVPKLPIFHSLLSQVTRVAPGLQQAFFDLDDSFSGLDCR